MLFLLWHFPVNNQHNVAVGVNIDAGVILSPHHERSVLYVVYCSLAAKEKVHIISCVLLFTQDLFQSYLLVLVFLYLAVLLAGKLLNTLGAPSITDRRDVHSSPRSAVV